MMSPSNESLLKTLESTLKPSDRILGMKKGGNNLLLPYGTFLTSDHSYLRKEKISKMFK